MKNDQSGERPSDPRHIYANPLQPEVCPILALGIYLMCFPCDTSSNQLFPGSNQDDRFGNTIRRVLSTTEGAAELTRRGLKPDSIGTHSIRKGSATYVSSGTTACPSAASVHRRAGWTMGRVPDIYLRYESAGDQYVGRTVSGLPLLSSDFAILPPFFSHNSDSVAAAIQQCFVNLPPSLVRVAEFCLASVVKHQAWLTSNLPANHRLFTTPLFRNPDMLTSLTALVECRTERSGDLIRASGIPPHTCVLMKLEKVTDRLEQVYDLLEVLPTRVRDVIMEELETRAVTANTITRDGMRQLLSDFGIPDIVQRLSRLEPGTLPARAAAAAADATAASQPTLFMWGGKFRRLPETFLFPTMTTLSAWQLWRCGDPSKGYPPFWHIHPTEDIKDPNTRKRFSDMKFLMNALEAKAKAANVWVETPTIEQANSIYSTAFPLLGLPASSETDRQRRMTQATFMSTVKFLRQKLRLEAAASGAGAATVEEGEGEGEGAAGDDAD